MICWKCMDMLFFDDCINLIWYQLFFSFFFSCFRYCCVLLFGWYMYLWFSCCCCHQNKVFVRHSGERAQFHQEHKWKAEWKSEISPMLRDRLYFVFILQLSNMDWFVNVQNASFSNLFEFMSAIYTYYDPKYICLFTSISYRWLSTTANGNCNGNASWVRNFHSSDFSSFIVVFDFCL